VGEEILVLRSKRHALLKLEKTQFLLPLLPLLLIERVVLMKEMLKRKQKNNLL
jgi:hypothetical protein